MKYTRHQTCLGFGFQICIIVVVVVCLGLWFQSLLNMHIYCMPFFMFEIGLLKFKLLTFVLGSSPFEMGLFHGFY